MISKKDLPYFALCLLAVIMLMITISSFTGGSRSEVSQTGEVFLYEINAEEDRVTGSTVIIENTASDHPVKVKLEQHWSTGIGGITDSRIRTITLAPSEKRSLGPSESEVAFIKGANFYKILDCRPLK